MSDLSGISSPGRDDDAADSLSDLDASSSNISSDTEGSAPGSPADEDYAEQITICRWNGCNDDTGSLDRLVKHIHDCHVGNRRQKYTCEWDECPRRGISQTSRFALVAHLRSHTGEKPFYCLVPECDKSFTRSDALAKHMRTVHEADALRPSDPIPKSHPQHPQHPQYQGATSSNALTTPRGPDPPLREIKLAPTDEPDEFPDSRDQYRLLKHKLQWAGEENKSLKEQVEWSEAKRRKCWTKKELLLEKVFKKVIGGKVTPVILLEYDSARVISTLEIFHRPFDTMSDPAGKPAVILCVGMAGSGKTTFMQRINAHLNSLKTPPYVINLDPAVQNVPYGANIDIRDTINYKEVMKQYNLGPNGGILTSLNLFTTKFDQVLGLLEKRADTLSHIIIDTPGQIEIFTWSASGTIITDALASSYPTCIAYIVDTPRTTSPNTFQANMLYACSILYKTKLPLIVVFNKTDVQDAEFAKEWMKDFEVFQAALREKQGSESEGGSGYMTSLMNSMSLMLEEFYKHLDVVGVSAMTGAGMEEFFDAVQHKVDEYARDYKPELERVLAGRAESQKQQQQGSLERLMRDLEVDADAQFKPTALACSKAIRHRGPDWSGNVIRKSTIFCHERLAIVGVDTGAQPLLNDDGSIVLAVNGEIYNHRDLKKTLKHIQEFKTHSDCEVIMYLYQEHGLDTPKMLDGMFSFVLHDIEKDRVIAARDPIGITTLYRGFSSRMPSTVFFASELKALHSVCDRIETFPPGHVFDSLSMETTRYYHPSWWDPQRIPVAPVDFAKLRETLTKSVRKRLMSEVPFGVLLSGGLDSSLIAAIASREAESVANAQRHKGTGEDIDDECASLAAWPRLHSFSIGLAGSPDLIAARQVAQFLGTIHHEHTFTIEEGLDALSDVVYHLETYDVTTIRASTPMYLLSRKIKAQGVKMVLSGEGSDEIFGGYLYFHAAPTPGDLHSECVSRVKNLHLSDCLRANKSTMAWGLEARVPFLDKEFLEVAMGVDPREKMSTPERMEKYILRKAFDTSDDPKAKPYLPSEILWRQKEQFSDGVGYGWIDALKDRAEVVVSDEQVNKLPMEWQSEEKGMTKEEYWYRSIFAGLFPAACGATVKRWVPRTDWQCPQDPSGRAQRVHRRAL
ncbi:putative asparagine synthetase [glutamine-hydrolyzing] [Neolecta irregularis DAH-3]|uniref:GPN-loop GTPase 1 n=1 Tax=Neolecta irregularis (strain DAH-3) TaxID=1198029 RepID=A0A1U7LRV8_NEOID|nr:putative asparagine synthetase [glutamine-hydrolyzing] [Neolecta irregularis DAH-3]|eukprot:OLL25406.1 putative asparagine synthetase [glutamine-hydrolyzing] [Neolecta irregularis DAH-3]